MHYFKTMMIENVHDIRKITSELNSDKAVLREQLIKMDTAFNLQLAQIERYSKETTIRQEQNLKQILKENLNFWNRNTSHNSKTTLTSR